VRALGPFTSVLDAIEYYEARDLEGRDPREIRLRSGFGFTEIPAASSSSRAGKFKLSLAAAGSRAVTRHFPLSRCHADAARIRLYEHNGAR
jgi:hypothetical protein